jgi:outer membrane protein assembly factor BamB
VCQRHEDAIYCAGDSIPPVSLDARTGEIRWRAEVVLAKDGTDTYEAAVLGVRDGTMLVRQAITRGDAETADVDVLGLDIGTGEQRWELRVNDENLDMALSAGLVITPASGRTTVSARSPRTGEERWTARIPKDRYCSFLQGGAEVYALCDGSMDEEAPSDTLMLWALDPADGSERRLTLPGHGLLGFLDGRLVMAQWTSEDEATAEAPTYDRVLLVDPDTGARTTVKFTEEYEGEPTLSGGLLWFVSDGGVVTAVSPLTGEQRWRARTSLEQPGEATYDVRTETVYLASGSGRVAALDGRDGQVRWETLPRSGGSSGMVAPRVLLYDGALVVTTGNGTVFSLDPADPERKLGSG